MNRLSRSQLTWIAGIIVAAFLLTAPYVVPLILNPFWLSVLTEILIWSIFTAGINLLFGYTGLLSFGQATFFGMGAYGVTLGITLLGLSFWPAALFGLLVSVLTAAIVGIFAVRLTWAYFAIITVVFSLIFYLVAVGWKDLTMGDDGISFTPPPVFKFGGIELTLLDLTFQYYFVLAVFAISFFLLWLVLKSPLGFAFVAVRENDMRLSLIGLSPYLIRYYSFVLAGSFCGLAGVLFALFSRYSTAQLFFWTISGEGLVWMLVGGAGTLLGPAIGTALLIVLREELSVYWEHYLILVGVIVIVVAIFAPKGLMGLFVRLLDRQQNARRDTAEAGTISEQVGKPIKEPSGHDRTDS